MSTTYDQGDIIRIKLRSHAASKEPQDDVHMVFVVSPKSFNALGAMMIAPISQGGDFARYAGFAVSLSGSGTKTQGVVLANMVRTVVLRARDAKLIEAAGSSITEEVIAKLVAILDGN